MEHPETKTGDQSVQGAAKVEATTQQAAQQAPGLGLQDLAIILNIVNIAIKRGAFEPKELRDVLDVHDKLEAFLQFQAQLQQATAQAKAEKEGDA